MAAGGFSYSIRKKLNTQYLRDTTQLDDRVYQIEQLKAKKARINKYHKKEKVAYIAADEYSSYYRYLAKESEVNMDEVKLGFSYSCKSLRPSNGKNPVKTGKNDKFATKTYTFVINKCGEIFGLLVTYGQIIVPQGLENPPLE